MTYEVQPTRAGYWVVRVPEKGRRVRLACYQTKAQADADKQEREQDDQRAHRRQGAPQ